MILLLLLIFAFANSLFFILPSQGIKGSSLVDIGFILIVVGLLWCWFVKRADISVYKNPFTWFIFIYLFFIFAQASFTTMYYGQSLSDSLVAARYQLYYAVFFLFLMVLDTGEKVKKFMGLLSILSVAIVGLAIINYYGFIIFDHKWAEGHGSERAGITRAFIPAMEVLVMVGLWHLIRYLEEEKASIFLMLMFLLIYAAIIFRQTRIYILAFSITVIIMLINKKQFKVLVGLAMCILLSSVLLMKTSVLEENIVLSSFQTAYQDVTEEEGTWKSRMRFINYNLESIKKYPYIGNGGLLIRDPGANPEWFNAAVRHDLGYLHVVKFTGIPGLIWMVSLIVVFYTVLVRTLRDPSADTMIAKFAGYLFTLILIAEVTINFFMDSWRILILCLSMAILVNSSRFKEKKYG